MSMSQVGSSSTNEQCPPCCIVDHTQHVLPQDYLHESDQLAVPVVMLRRYPDAEGQIRQYPFSVTLDIVRYQYPHDFEQWIFIGGEDTPGIDLTVESAQRLGEMLRRIGGLGG